MRTLADNGVCLTAGWLLPALLLAAIAYFLGCFNGAVIVSKYILRDDVRGHGSGNAGLTNFYRTFGGALTFVVILCDVLKAVVAVWAGQLLLRGWGGGAGSGTVLLWPSTGRGFSACWGICSPACSASRAARASSPAAPSPS